MLLQPILGQALDAAGTKALVEKISAARKEHPYLEASYREEKSGGILARPAISNGKLWFSAPDKFRKESRGAGRDSVIVSNGELLWMYYPAFKEAERYDLKKQKFLSQGIATFTSGLDFAQVDRDFTITAEEYPEDYALTLLPKKAVVSRMLQQLVVRFNKKLVLQSVETVSPRGEKIRTELSNLTWEPIPATTFEFAPPSDANITSPLGK